MIQKRSLLLLPRCGGLDCVGKLYGTTVTGGEVGWGVVYELSSTSNGIYNETIFHSFNTFPLNSDGCNPFSYLVFDHAGNLYGTTQKGGGGWVGGTFCQNCCGRGVQVGAERARNLYGKRDS